MRAAVIKNGEVVNVIVVDSLEDPIPDGELIESPPGRAEIGMTRSADGQFRRPDDVGRPDEPGAP